MTTKIESLLRILSLGTLSIAISFRLFMPGLTVTMGENIFVCLFSWIALCTALSIQWQKRVSVPLFILLPIAWILFCFLSVFWSVDTIACLYQSFLWLSDIALFFVVWYWISKESSVGHYIIALCISLVTIEVLYGIYQYFIEMPALREYFQNHNFNLATLKVSTTLNAFQNKLAQLAIFGHFTLPNSLGAYFAIFFPIIWYMTFQNKKKYILLILSIMLTFALYLTLSRSAILALISILMLLLLYYFYKRYSIKIFCIICFALFCSSALLFYSIVYTPLFNIVPNKLLSFLMREGYFGSALRIFGSHSLLGVGVANFSQYYYAYKLPWVEEVQNAHNAPVQFLAEFGIVGSCILFFMIVYIIRLIYLYKNQSVIGKISNHSFFTKMAYITFICTIFLLYSFHRLFDIETSMKWLQYHYSYLCFIVPLFPLVLVFVYCFVYHIISHIPYTKNLIIISLLILICHSLLDVNAYEPVLSQYAWLLLAFLLPNPEQLKKIWIPKYCTSAVIVLVISFILCIAEYIIPTCFQIENLKERAHAYESEHTYTKQEYISAIQLANQYAPWDVATAIRYAHILPMEQALQPIQTALKWNQRNIALHYNQIEIMLNNAKQISNIHKRRDALLQTREQANQLLTLYPNSPIFLQLIGNIEEQLRNYVLAKEYYKRALLASDVNASYDILEKSQFLNNIEKMIKK